MAFQVEGRSLCTGQHVGVHQGDALVGLVEQHDDGIRAVIVEDYLAGLPGQVDGGSVGLYFPDLG